MREVTDISKSSASEGFKISSETFYMISMIYLMIPVLIFTIGYLRPGVAIPVSVIFAGLTVVAVLDCGRGITGEKLSCKTYIKIPYKYLIAFAVIALLISFITGVGEFIFTLQDHPYRRAILRDLIDYKWPVIYDYSTQTNPEVRQILGFDGGKVAFCYYFAYFLPAAVVGKILGLGAANIFLLIWNALGMALTLVGMTYFTKRASFAIPFVYVFFAGLDALPDAFYAVTHYEAWLWLEGYVPCISYIANFTEYCNVFNQVVPCFLVMTLILMQKNTRSMALTAGVLFAYSPWAVIGMIPVAIARLLDKDTGCGRGKHIVKNVLSPVNILSVIALLTVFGSFYMANSGAVEYRGFTISFYEEPLWFIPCYLIFILVEIGAFVLILGKEHKKDPVFIAAVITLLILPFYRISEMNDLTMRGSMPALFVLQIYLAAKLTEIFEIRDIPKGRGIRLRLTGICLAVVLMMFPALENMFVIFGSQLTGDVSNAENIGSFGNINQAEYAEVIKEQFYIDDYGKTFFFRYLAKD